MSYLILVRHGQSEYNLKGLWTGWDNPSLTEKGEEEAKTAAKTLTDIPFDIGYTSLLKRHIDTLEIIKNTLQIPHLPVIQSKELNERNYGAYTRKNKWEVKKEIGEEEFQKLRRGWDYPIPEGESLKDVSARVVKYYNTTILPELKSGKNVIISSSGNALRSLIKYLEEISDDDIASVEIATAEAYVYQLDIKGKITSKEVRNQHPNTA